MTSPSSCRGLRPVREDADPASPRGGHPGNSVTAQQHRRGEHHPVPQSPRPQDRHFHQAVVRIRIRHSRTPPCNRADRGLEPIGRVAHHGGIEAHSCHHGEHLPVDQADVHRSPGGGHRESDCEFRVRRQPEGWQPSRLPVPAGSTAKAASEPSIPATTARDRSIPTAGEHDLRAGVDGRRACPVPGSCAVVSPQDGAGHPACASTVSMIRRRSARSVTRAGFRHHRRLSHRPPDLF